MARESAAAPGVQRESVFGNSRDPLEDVLHERAAILLRELAIDDPRSAQRDRRSGMDYWRDSIASTIPRDGSRRSLVDSYSARVIRLRNEGVLPNELRNV